MSLKEKSAVLTGGKRARQWPQELIGSDGSAQRRVSNRKIRARPRPARCLAWATPVAGS
jgi:hypothetical protein